MKQKIFITFVLFVLNAGLVTLQAQDAVLVSGGNVSGKDGSVSYSVGQVVYTSITNTNGSVIQGIQQVYEVTVVTSVEQNDQISLECSAYPNPTTNFLILKIDSDNLTEVSFQLYDTNGKLIQTQKVTETETTIQLNHLSSASYILNVVSMNRNIKTFKIIKN